MKINGNTITLTGNDLAIAIDAYLTAHRIIVVGPRTISFEVDGGERAIARAVTGEVYVDPMGRIIDSRHESE